jgi:uncharacterized membrane protein YbjE (DUF340 family)
MLGSLIIVAFFVIGVLLAMYGLMPESLIESYLSFYALCALMLFVGFSIGHDKKTLNSFRSLNPRLLLLPLMTIIGTLAGTFLISFVLPHRSPSDCMAVGSGFAYYSLSSIIITDTKGAELGVIALMSNIIRELSALLLAPFFVKYFGRLAPISVGGATSMDTTLPIITKYSGKDFVVTAIFHGLVVDFSVIFLVTLFCSF